MDKRKDVIPALEKIEFDHGLVGYRCPKCKKLMTGFGSSFAYLSHCGFYRFKDQEANLKETADFRDYARLRELAINNPETFNKVVQMAKKRDLFKNVNFKAIVDSLYE